MGKADVHVVEDNSEEAREGIGAAIVRALEKVGLTAEAYAKGLCPVDTGRLRNSVTHAMSGHDVFIGTNVEYGPYVELGTSHQNAQPFLRPAAENHGEEYRGILEDELKSS